MKTISILIPLYNEEEMIDVLLSSLTEVVGKQKEYRFQFVFVDDGSSDQTIAKLLASRPKLLPHDVAVIEFSRNFGKEAAITAGLDFVDGDACVIFDADLQDPPEILDTFISFWDEGYEVVATRRNDRTSDNFIKRQTSKLFYRINNLTSDIHIPENVGDCRLMDRIVVDALRSLPESRRFMKGLFAWVGFRTKLIDVVRPPRSKGVTKFPLIKLISFAIDGITSFSTSLLRLWTFVGIFVSIYAAFHGVYILVRTTILGVQLPGYASLIVVLMFFGGLQMVGLGIIGEYVGRTFQEAKRRPSYIIRRSYEVGNSSSDPRSDHDTLRRRVSRAAFPVVG